MTTRKEVLLEFGTAQCVRADDCDHWDCRAERLMADEIVRLRELLSISYTLDAAPTFSTPRDPLPPAGAVVEAVPPVVTVKPQFFAYDESFGKMVNGTFTPTRVVQPFWTEWERDEWIAYNPRCRGKVTAALRPERGEGGL